MDVLATVPAFPSPDAKVRTTSLSSTGGGNAANTSTGIARLGLPVSFVSQVGNDAHAAALTAQLSADGVDVSRVRIDAQHPSASAFVIVDAAANTRTVIATVPPDIAVDAEFAAIVHQLLHVQHHWALCLLDGRHTDAAVYLATQVKTKCHYDIPILLDVERNRPRLSYLLPLADYIVTNDTYPYSFTHSNHDHDSDSDSDHALHAGMAALLNVSGARFVIATRGPRGATLLQRHSHPSTSTSTSDAVPVRIDGVLYDVVDAAAATAENVVDTTGAGDAFIAGVAYAIVHKMPVRNLLNLAAYVAARSVEHAGARAGMPWRSQIPNDLLE